ncbi:hypothetical protein F4820DRAFT_418624 [Hypoxylon rubiginosum]|uniref:Uncharacterized protein n=1 Tax=Hypoxylon rubiginosum TaxID=110542 RepID=A0ACB9Z3K2_9PEZI|nr:hypothetical protein F4820DRAFT_418624 [Hypoxylon rubiginosum]
MPAATDGPTVSLSFANNFWGKDDAGVGPLLDRMASAKQTSDELRSFYSARCSIEEEYARKLLSLCRKSLGTHEMGSLRISLDTVRGEVESMGKQHANIASQMKSELEEPLAAFAGGMKERRKIVQNTVEKLLKVKIQQTNMVNKTRDRYEQDCLKIKGYLAQGHMVMGQEERKNKARLEKTQISLATTNTEYENAIKALEETTARWNREWKAAADKFQDLEEERLDFTKSSLWTFANIASTVCVSDDASCEKIRLSLETMDVEKDILNFINERGTGQEIPDPPKYINFCRGDVEDHHSEVSDDENYSVAQFPRSINPAFRTSSPQPSTFESHHDPNSALARDLAHHEPPPLTVKEPESMSQKAMGAIMPLQDRRQTNGLQQQFPRSINPGFRAPSPQPSTYESHHDPNSSLARELQRREPDSPAVSRDIQRHNAIPPMSRELQHREPNPPLSREPRYEVDQTLVRDLQRHDPNPLLPRDLQRETNPLVVRDLVRNEPPAPTRREPPAPAEKAPSSVVASRDLAPRGRRQDSNGGQYDASQFAPVPHDPYPMDGMTMLCRTDGMNSATSSNLSARPSSRDDNSEYSNPTSFSSQEPPSGKVSPVKQEPAPVAQPEKRMLKKKSGFFQNHSPFRRKSMKDVQPPAQSSNRNTWGPVSSQNAPAPRRPQAYQPPEPRNLIADRIEKTASPEPIEANASLALNIGQNVFPVANTDKRNKHADEAEPPQEQQDPIALALAELKGVAGNKAAAERISADHYHGIATPRPDRVSDRSPAMSRSVPAPSRGNSDLAAGIRGTPPPSYDQQVQRLGVPPPAVTSKAMKESSRKYVEQTRDIFNQKRPGSSAYSGGQSFSSTPSRPTTRGNDMPRNMPRAASPAPPRSASPQPSIHPDTRQSHRSVSPNPYSSSQQQHRNSTQAQAASPKTYTAPAASPSSYGGNQMRNSPQAASPSSYGGAQARNSPQASMSVKRGSDQGYHRHNSSTNSVRAASPSPYRGDYSRPASRASEMAMALAPVGGDGSVYGGSMRGRGSNGRPDTSHSSRAMTFYDGRDPLAETSKPRSQSVVDPSRQYTPDGRAILHYARALYMYQAAIPEELGFAKGDVLAVLRHQDDGWWEAEIHSGQGVGRGGLVPSNYLQAC